MESDAEFGDGLLEGILSQSEDSEEEEESEEEDEDEEDEDIQDLSGLDSDEIPSEEGDSESEAQNGELGKSNGMKADENSLVLTHLGRR